MCVITVHSEAKYLTLRSRVLCQKLIVPQLINKFAEFYVTPCIFLQLIHGPTNAFTKLQFITSIKLLHVSAPWCHRQGVLEQGIQTQHVSVAITLAYCNHYSVIARLTATGVEGKCIPGVDGQTRRKERLGRPRCR